MQEWNTFNNLFTYVWIRLDSAKFVAIGIAIYLIPVIIVLDATKLLFNHWNKYIKISSILNIINGVTFYFLFNVGHILQPDAGPSVYMTMAIFVLVSFTFSLMGFKNNSPLVIKPQ
jgi:hypothetical protein